MKELKVMLKFILILITSLLMNTLTYADNKKIKEKTVIEKLRETINSTPSEKDMRDAFYQCWIDNIKANSTDSHTNVVALYCRNKTGFNPLNNNN